MGLKAMLTVDLNRTTEDQRNTFNRELEVEKWAKIKILTTMWQATFQDNVSEDGVIRISKSDVAKAAATAGITSYDVGLMIGQNLPTVWQKR